MRAIMQVTVDQFVLLESSNSNALLIQKFVRNRYVFSDALAPSSLEAYHDPYHPPFPLFTDLRLWHLRAGRRDVICDRSSAWCWCVWEWCLLDAPMRANRIGIANPFTELTQERTIYFKSPRDHVSRTSRFVIAGIYLSGARRYHVCVERASANVQLSQKYYGSR